MRCVLSARDVCVAARAMARRDAYNTAASPRRGAIDLARNPEGKHTHARARSTLLTLNPAIRKGPRLRHRNRPRWEIINPICAAKPRAGAHPRRAPRRETSLSWSKLTARPAAQYYASLAAAADSPGRRELADDDRS